MKKVFLAFAAAAAMMMAGCNSQKQETPAAAKADGEAVVYLTRDISPEGLVNIYKALGVEAKGRVAVKISTGEGSNPNYLKPELIKNLVQMVDGTIVECNTAYGDVFGTWRAMEKAYHDGKVRAIGVSNFQSGRFFDFAHYVDVKPMVNQLQCNTLIQQTAIEPILAEFGTRMMAWGPLGGQGVEGIVKSEELAAIGAKYGKSAAQVALRWLTQRGVVAIPKSSHKERMAQNFDIFDFTLTADDMAAVAKLNQHDTGTIDFGDPQFVKYLIENYG